MCLCGTWVCIPMHKQTFYHVCCIFFSYINTFGWPLSTTIPRKKKSRLGLAASYGQAQALLGFATGHVLQLRPLSSMAAEYTQDAQLLILTWKQSKSKITEALNFAAMGQNCWTTEEALKAETWRSIEVQSDEIQWKFCVQLCRFSLGLM